MRSILLALIVLGMMGCNPEDVNTNDSSSTKLISNRAIITFGDLKVGDSLYIYTNMIDVGGKITRDIDTSYFPCNIYNNPLYPIRYSGGCDDNTFEVSADNDITFKYKGDITIEYLFD